jgi:hypothetical protein
MMDELVDELVDELDILNNQSAIGESARFINLNAVNNKLPLASTKTTMRWCRRVMVNTPETKRTLRGVNSLCTMRELGLK